MTLDALLQFLRGDIKMSHIYQPVLIRTLLDNGGFCTRRQLALALLMQDESQIEYYEKRLRDMPPPVLKKRGVISETNGVVRLEVGKLSCRRAHSSNRLANPEIRRGAGNENLGPPNDRR